MIALLGVALALGAPVATAEEHFQAATEAMARSDYREAAALFEMAAGGSIAPREMAADAGEKLAQGGTPAPPQQARAARRYSGGGLAVAALSKAAQLYEERLGQPQRALELYRQIVELEPGSRLARRAERRLEILSAAIDPVVGGAVLAEYNDILYGYASRSAEESENRMRALLARHPNAPIADEARYWLAASLEREGRLIAAERWYRSVHRLHRRSPLAWRARKAEADVLLMRGRYDDAASAYRKLITDSTGASRRIAEDALAAALRERSQARLAWLGWAGLAVFLAFIVVSSRRAVGSWPLAARGLLRPPGELLFMLPVALLFAAAAATVNILVGRAVLYVLGGSLLVTWTSGATLEMWHRARGRLRAHLVLVHVLCALLAIACITYVAVTSERVVELLAETWKHGPAPH